MNPSTGRFVPLTEEQARLFEGFPRMEQEEFVYEAPVRELVEAHRKHKITTPQLFRVGEKVEIKGCEYRVKSIHSNSIVFYR